jgi:hypothetical protein
MDVEIALTWAIALLIGVDFWIGVWRLSRIFLP